MIVGVLMEAYFSAKTSQSEFTGQQNGEADSYQ